MTLIVSNLVVLGKRMGFSAVNVLGVWYIRLLPSVTETSGKLLTVSTVYKVNWKMFSVQV